MDTELLDAKLSAVKAQNDASFTKVLAELDKVNSNLSAFGETVRVRLDSLDNDVRAAKDAAHRSEEAARAIRANIIASALGLAAVLLALAALWGQAVDLVRAAV